ncbi:hypothetical protein M5K25_007683 [Dendrobium thyrsiflorum]|uniref:Uncharacterized protein n=1 Tax=Dendrobium thyrsiflorum TaxID=117978 RepID=A0ABD0VEY1_DENTH
MTNCSDTPNLMTLLPDLPSSTSKDLNRSLAKNFSSVLAIRQYLSSASSVCSLNSTTRTIQLLSPMLDVQQSSISSCCPPFKNNHQTCFSPLKNSHQPQELLPHPPVSRVVLSLIPSGMEIPTIRFISGFNATGPPPGGVERTAIKVGFHENHIN